MRGEAGRLTLVAAVAIAAGCATAKPAGPPRMAVHEDVLAPELVSTFVDARLKFVAHLKARGATDLRGTMLQIGEHTFWTLYPFRTWRDLARRAEQIDVRMKNVVKPELEAYTRDSDRSLVFPHKSEIWIEEPDLELGHPAPAELLDAGYATLVIEDVKPTLSEQYGKAWAAIAKALEQEKYPLKRVSYFGFYGSGRMMSFWIAPSEAMLKAAPPIAQALAIAVGEARAAELLKTWRECVIATETLPVVVRHEMSSPP